MTQKAQPALKLPDPLMDDLCSRSLFTDYSTLQLRRVAKQLLAVHGPAYPGITPTVLVKLWWQLKVPTFGAAIARDMEILPRKKVFALADSARDLAAANVRRALVEGDHALLLELLEPLQGAWAVLFVLAAVSDGVESRKITQTIGAVKVGLREALRDEGRMR